MKRQRGRGRKPGGGGGGGGNHGNHGNRPFESNGPEVKIRGTAAQIYEKYAQYARDAQSGGDRVKYENYLQHAEHYYRVMAASMPRDRLLAQQEGGFGQAQGEGGQGGEGQGNFGQPQQGAMGGNPNMGQGQGEGADSADPMKVMDDQSGPEDDGGDYDNEGDDQGAEGEREEVRAAGNDDQGGAQGDRNGRRRRRGRRGRPGDGPNDNGGGGGGGNTGGGGGGSALDSLARKQGALAGG